MRSNVVHRPATTPATKRVAIYTRQSVERENGGEFGSIEAQREAVLAYVASQRSEGWVASEAIYDDRGISGGKADRPALNRLLADIRDRRVDIVACYKIDRLSRSLLDFTRFLALFEEHEVAFVSVTQNFNSTTSVGRLTLNLLGTFAQFEREQISERTADKIRASRERGLWTGGKPMLGFDAVEGKLIVNENESERVREIFAIYLERGTIPSTLAEMRHRGIANKAWTNKAGKRTGGRDFDKVSLRALLSNPLVVGKIRAGDRVVKALHAPIVDPQVFDAVQRRLDERRAIVEAGMRTLKPWGPLLGGIVKCKRCGRRMGHTSSARRERRYTYYTCVSIQKHGAHACPGSRVSATELEQFVVSKLKGVGTDPDLARKTLEAARVRLFDRENEIREELRRLGDERRHMERSRGAKDVAADAGTSARTDGPTGVDSAADDLDAKLEKLRAEQAALAQPSPDDAVISAALATFTSMWEALAPNERRRVVTLLVEKVVVDAPGGTVELVLRDRALQAVLERGAAVA